MDTNPGQTAWFSTQGGNGWDYNCDANAEERWDTLTNCSFGTGQNHNIVNKAFAQFKNLASTHGWETSVPNCGEVGETYYDEGCFANSNKTQECR